MATPKVAHDTARHNSRRTRTRWCVVEKSPGIYDAVPEDKLGSFPYAAHTRVLAHYRSGRSVPPTKRA